MAFVGTRLDLVASKSTNYGIALVAVDGAEPVEVDFYNPVVAYKQVVWTSGTLTAGAHHVSITAKGAHSASSSGNTIGLDAVDVAGALTGP